MKKDKEKRKHHESTIGKIIYGFLLFLPLLAIGITCGYAMFNKNAYKSYYGEDINHHEFTLVESENDLIIGDRYLVSTSTETDAITNPGLMRFYISELHDFSYPNSILFDPYEADSFNFTYYTTNYIVFYKENEQLGVCNLSYAKLSFNFVLEQNGYSSNVEDYIKPNSLYKYDYNQNSFVSEVFYYSINRVEQSNLFNWAKTSMIYTGMLNFTTALNVTNTFMPMLLTYWLIISVIYFLYDIILIILVVLHRKIHELQESI